MAFMAAILLESTYPELSLKRSPDPAVVSGPETRTGNKNRHPRSLKRWASLVLIDAESLLEAPLSIPNRPEFAPFEDHFRRNY
jgi:hypothetical protein